MILIAGDSWAFGEWSDDNINLNHLGLTEYIGELGIQAMTLGNRGGSNYEAIKSVDDFYFRSRNLAQTVEGIYFFQTEWIRDLRLFDIPKEGYCSVKSHFIAKFYYHLVEISQKYQVPIYVIGGLSDVDVFPNFFRSYPGVTIACSSFVNLLLENDNYSPTFMVSGTERLKESFDDYMKKIKSCSTDVDIQEFINDVELSNTRLELFKNNPQYFWPDGKHPNRHAYKILFDYLLTNNFIKS